MQLYEEELLNANEFHSFSRPVNYEYVARPSFKFVITLSVVSSRLLDSVVGASVIVIYDVT